MKPLYSKPLAFVDVETTGASPYNSRIIEVGIFRIEPDGKTSRLSTLIRPDHEIIPEFITGITGIHQSQVLDAPLFSEVIQDVREILNEAYFVAHNARFDFAFMRNEFRRAGQKFSAKVVCSIQVMKRLYPDFKKYNLTFLTEHFGIEIKNRHRAYDDAVAVYEMFQIAVKEKGGDAFVKVIDELSAHKLDHCKIPRTEISALPEGPGIYLFYNVDGECLYVGKSVHIKDRVRSHIYQSLSDAKERRIIKEASTVKAIKTPGELSAFLLESQKIKELQPKHNRFLKKPSDYMIAYPETGDDGYARLRLIRAADAAGDIFEKSIGVFRNAAQADRILRDLSKQFHLCHRFLGLEKTDRACLASQLEECLGACEGREEPASYNERFSRAFHQQKIRRWPYGGGIVIDESDEEEQTGVAIVVDEWKILGRLYYSGGDAFKSERLDGIFDWDAYKILSKYVLKSHQSVRITEVPRSRIEDLFMNT